MSCPTGIRPNDELRALFARCKDGKHRLVKMVIKDEELQLAGTASVRGSVEEDIGRELGRMVADPAEPCYFLLLLGESSLVPSSGRTSKNMETENLLNHGRA